jgi:hypothetical protein
MPTTETTPVTKKRFRWKLWLGIGLAAPIVLLVLYTVFTLNWSYAKGERAGYVQKFSSEGWIVKTWEGELAIVNLPGTAPEKFFFTVRDDAVAAQISKAMGKRVSLIYEQHKGVPSRVFGETEFFVVDVRVLE